jgi:hypothetical protein
LLLFFASLFAAQFHTLTVKNYPVGDYQRTSVERVRRKTGTNVKKRNKERTAFQFIHRIADMHYQCRATYLHTYGRVR